MMKGKTALYGGVDANISAGDESPPGYTETRPERLSLELRMSRTFSW